MAAMVLEASASSIPARSNGNSYGNAAPSGEIPQEALQSRPTTPYEDANDDSGHDSDGAESEVFDEEEPMNSLSDDNQDSEKQTESLPTCLSDALTSRITELEATSSTGDKTDEEAQALARARKRTVKDFKALAEAGGRTMDEKLKLLQAKFMQQVQERRELEKELVALRRKCEQLHKERDAALDEVQKGRTVKSKLESLCRELQKQNKTVVEDSKRMVAEEESKRQELSARFHNTIKEITSKMEEQGDERMRQLKENELLREKLKHFTQQYEIREQHFAHQLRTKALEQQLVEAKLKQQMEKTHQEESKVRMYSDQITALLKTEAELRSQLTMYGDKFEQFQDTLTKSNEVFATFKKEMEKMSKTIKRLEKDNSALREKSQKTDLAIVELAEEREKWRKAAETAKSQKEKLESLCRSLQAERKLARAMMAPPTSVSTSSCGSSPRLDAVASVSSHPPRSNKAEGDGGVR